MKPVKTLSKASVNKYMRRISGMFNFAEERKYTTINPFRKKQIREDKQPDENRDILSGEDLSALFNPDRFYSKLDTPFKYWIPLIGLYTGARLNEIAEMDAADIVEEKGVWCFYFNTSKQKARRKRLIPVHSHLKKLGLLQYAHAQTGKLFPELRKRRDGYGQEVSRWYNQYRRECGLTEIRNGDFHCYRHTMSTALDKAGVRSKTISQIIGHSTGGPKQTTTERVYIKKDEIEIRAAAIEKLNYGEPVNNLEPYDILFPSASFESAICLTTRSTDDELL
jgi:integrase